MTKPLRKISCSPAKFVSAWMPTRESNWLWDRSSHVSVLQHTATRGECFIPLVTISQGFPPVESLDLCSSPHPYQVLPCFQWSSWRDLALSVWHRDWGGSNRTTIMTYCHFQILMIYNLRSSTRVTPFPEASKRHISWISSPSASLLTATSVNLPIAILPATTLHVEGPPYVD